MQVLDYLYKYQKTDFKTLPFNEVDALLLAMVSYFPFDELNNQKTIYSSEDVLKRINEYKPPHNTGERKLKYMEMTKTICLSNRFKGIKFAWFKKIHDKQAEKQFQAITLILKDFAYVSFCGTDSTTLGWKEDFNMAYLEMVPSETEAVKYLNEISYFFFFKKFYTGGHSKGGRLAISAAKALKKKNKLLGVYSFDAPNFPPAGYDENYKSVDSLIHAYTPDESIIGRLMHEYRRKSIIASSNALLMQHDAFSWELFDHTFIYKNAYTERSTHIVDTINYALYNYDEDRKKDFIDTIFDFLARLDIEKLPPEKELLPFLASKFGDIKEEWKNTSKEKRAVVKKMLFDIAKDYLFTSKKKKN